MGSEFRWGSEMFGNLTSELLDDIEPSFTSLEDSASSCLEDSASSCLEDMIFEDSAPLNRCSKRLDSEKRCRRKDRPEQSDSVRKSRLNRTEDSRSDDYHLEAWVVSTPTQAVKKSRSNCLDEMLLEDAFPETEDCVAYSTPVRSIEMASKYPETEIWCDGDASAETEEAAVECTPLRGSDKRRSVSLVDVSKIEPYTSRPLSNAMTSWETMGSQSSVGKSRDSGYMHCGSLASVSSSKGLECSGDDVSLVVEECTRLRRELEYSQVLINTLQDSNNQLRIKCAAAHSRISEMRHRSANSSVQNQHPMCEEEWSGVKERVNCDSLYLDSSNSSEETTTEEEEGEEEEEDDCMSDILQPLPTTRLLPLSQNNSAKQGEEEVESCSEDLIRSMDSEAWSFKDSGLSTPRSQDLNNSYRISDRVSSSSSREFFSGTNAEVGRYAQLERIYNCSGGNAVAPVKSNESLVPNSRGIVEAKVLKSFSAKDLRRSQLASDRCTIDDEQTVPKSKESHVRSIENLMASLVSDDRNMSDDSVFVANEVDGKVCVGKFQVWDKNNKCYVESPSQIEKASTPTVKVRSATPLLSDAKSPLDLRVGSSGCSRVSPRCCCFDNGSPFRQSSPHWNGVRITVSQSGSKCSRHSPMSGRDSQTSSRSTPADSSRSFASTRDSPLVRSGSLDKVSRCADETRVYSPVDSCRDNLSKLGVTVSKTALTTALEGWKTLKSKMKMERMRFGGSDRTASGDSSQEVETSRVGIATPLKPNNFATTPSQLKPPGAEESTVLNPTDLGDNLKDTESFQPQTLEECVKRACEYASELSRGIERLPRRLESIYQIGKQ